MKNRANETVSGTDGTAHANTPVASETIASLADTNTHASIQPGQTTGTVSDAAAASTLADTGVAEGNDTSGTEGTAQADTQVGEANETVSGTPGVQTPATTTMTGPGATSAASLGGLTPTSDHAVAGVAPSTTAMADTHTAATPDASLGGSTPTSDHAVASVAPSTAATAGSHTTATPDASLGGSTPTSDHAVASVSPSIAATAGSHTTATPNASLGGSTLTTDHAVASVCPSTAATAGAHTPTTPTASLGGSTLTTDHAVASVAPSTGAIDSSTGTSAQPNTIKLAAFLDSQGDIFVFNTNTNPHQGTADIHAGQDAIDLASILKQVGSLEQALADHTANLVAHATDAAMVSPSHDPTAGTPAVTLDHLLPQQLHASDLFFH